MASGREGTGFCSKIHRSSRLSNSGWRRSPTFGPMPVGGRPRLRFFSSFLVSAI